MTCRIGVQLIFLAVILGISVGTATAQPTSQPTTGPAIRVISDFECGTTLTSEIPGPNHVVITLADHISLDGWIFRLEGVAGKTVQIDITASQKLNKWKTLNPVYAPATDLNDPALYVAGPSTGQTLNANQVKLPDTAGQKWHYIEDTKLGPKNTFTMTHTFDTDAVWIANRVPYTPAFNERFIHSLDKNPLAKVIEIGRSGANRPLLMVQIGGDDPAAKTKATLLIAGGEQATEPDGMWSAQGAIEFLLADTDVAKRLRDHCRFLIIPMLDPDGTADDKMYLPNTFHAGSQSATAIAYANFFQQWIQSGNRLDVVFEIHNIQSSEYPHLSRAFIENLPPRGALADAINNAVISKFKSADLIYSPKVQVRTLPTSRFGGWLSANYGPLLIIYEINAQDPTRHLDLLQLKATGGLFVESAGDFLFSPASSEFLAAVDAARVQHQTNWTSNPATQPTQNALDSEAAARPAGGAPNQTPQLEPHGL